MTTDQLINQQAQLEIEDQANEGQALCDQLRKLKRETLVRLVEGIGAAAFDDDSDDDLIGCIADSVRAGDIDLSALDDDLESC